MSEFFVKYPVIQDPDWFALSPLTRGLLAELLAVADRDGRVRLGRAGLPSVAVSLRSTWAEVEAHVLALLEVGQIEHDVEGRALVVVSAETVPRPLTPAERKAAERLRRAAEQKSAESDGMSRMSRMSHASRDVTIGHEGDRDSHDESRGVTIEKVTSRDVTLKIDRLDQTRLDRAEARDAPASAPPADPLARDLLAKLAGTTALAGIATSAHAETLAGRCHAKGTKAQWALAALDDLARDAQAAADAGSPWGREFLAAKAARYVDHARAPAAPKPPAGRGPASPVQVACTLPAGTLEELLALPPLEVSRGSR